MTKKKDVLHTTGGNVTIKLKKGQKFDVGPGLLTVKRGKSSKTPVGLDLKTFTDEWARQKAELEAIALEAVNADTAFVEAHRANQTAQENLKRALGRKTAAEAKLAALRANLGGKDVK